MTETRVTPDGVYLPRESWTFEVGAVLVPQVGVAGETLVVVDRADSFAIGPQYRVVVQGSVQEGWTPADTLEARYRDTGRTAVVTDPSRDPETVP